MSDYSRCLWSAKYQAKNDLWVRYKQFVSVLILLYWSWYAYASSVVVAKSFTKVKVKLLDILGDPHLVFTASRTIKVGEELLFDYNDKHSRLAF